MQSAIDSAPARPVPEETATARGHVRAWLVPAVALLAVLGLGVWTRMRDLGVESFWYDECITFFRARFPIPRLISDSLGRNHVPTYFIVMHYLLPLGDDEWWLRLPSAVFGMLKVPILAATGWVLGGPRVGLAAGLLLVLSPQQLHYDQEARMYALQNLAICFSLLGQLWLLSHPQAAVHCFSRKPPGEQAAPAAAQDPRELRMGRVAWVLWGFGTALALWLHNTSPLFLTASSYATLVLLLLDRSVRKRMFWHWVVANLVVLLLWSPWWPSLLRQLQDRSFAGNDFSNPPSARQLWSGVRDLMLGGSNDVINGLMLALVLLGAFELRRRPVILLALLLLSLSAPGQLFLISHSKPLFVPRLFLWGGLAAHLLAAHAALFARRGWLAAVLVAGLFGAVTVLGLRDLEQNYYAKTTKHDWRGAARVIESRLGKTGLAVYGLNRRERLPLTYYAEREKDRIPIPRLIDAEPRSRPPINEIPKDVRHLLLVYGTQLKGKRVPRIARAAEDAGRKVARTRLRGVTVDEYRIRVRRPARPEPAESESL
jgi:mannosyltransferase